MAATTAIVLIGIAHPNDGGLSPTHMFELLEGDRATWVLHNLTGKTPKKPVKVSPSQPDRIARSLLGMIGMCLLPPVSNWHGGNSIEIEGEAADAAIAFQGSFAALSVVLYKGSTLAYQLGVLETMTHWQIDVFAPVWSKRRNLFAPVWKVDGTLADFPE